jgi:prepilin-type N-terminal cleavage/methylation domain-containing protein
MGKGEESAKLGKISADMNAHSREDKFFLWEPRGFTLIELMVATAIAAVVIGIVSVCFSFSLRVWHMSATSKPDLTFRMVELLQRQLAECDPTPLNFPNGARPLFTGNASSICFLTAHSVKAISKGVPVAVRYNFDSSAGVLSYSETVMNPYRPQGLQKFAAASDSSGEPASTPVYKIDFPKFSISYAGKGSTEFTNTWDSTQDLPIEILISWEGMDHASHSEACMVNSPFPIEPNLLNSSTPSGLNPINFPTPGGLNP